jgi:hypothetical protein
VGEEGQCQIKAPWNTVNHIETLLNGMPEEHIPQMQFELWVTGRKWSDFVSYDPRMPEEMSLYVQRIHRDEAYISALAKECEAFWGEVQEMVASLRKLFHLKQAA